MPRQHGLDDKRYISAPPPTAPTAIKLEYLGALLQLPRDQPLWLTIFVGQYFKASGCRGKSYVPRDRISRAHGPRRGGFCFHSHVTR